MVTAEQIHGNGVKSSKNGDAVISKSTQNHFVQQNILQKQQPRPGNPHSSGNKKNVRAPHEEGGQIIDFEIIVITSDRWRPASMFTSDPSLSNGNKPYILVHTLAFLKEQTIPAEIVTLHVEDEYEQAYYSLAVLQDDYWQRIRIIVRNDEVNEKAKRLRWPVRKFAYTVELDDDISSLVWLNLTLPVVAQSLPPGAFHNIVYNAHEAMTKKNDFTWMCNSINLYTSKHKFVSENQEKRQSNMVTEFLYGFVKHQKFFVAEALLALFPSYSREPQENNCTVQILRRVHRFREKGKANMKSDARLDEAFLLPGDPSAIMLPDVHVTNSGGMSWLKRRKVLLMKKTIPASMKTSRRHRMDTGESKVSWRRLTKFSRDEAIQKELLHKAGRGKVELSEECDIRHPSAQRCSLGNVRKEDKRKTIFARRNPKKPNPKKPNPKKHTRASKDTRQQGHLKKCLRDGVLFPDLKNDYKRDI